MRVAKVEKLAGSDRINVYDVEVSDNHNFFVKPNGSESNVLVHNCHKGNADCYAQVLRTVYPRYLYTVTATRKRKDCLLGGTLVVTPQGNVPIEDIKVGDTVIAHDGQNPVDRKVLETHVRPASKAIIRIEHEHGTIEGTEDHEVWCINRRTWVALKDVTIEDELSLIPQ